MNTVEIEKNFKEIWDLFKETDKKFKETDREIKETNKEIKETNKEIEKATKAVYALTGKWARFVEGLIAPAAERLFKERGIEVDKIFQRVKGHRNGEGLEVDILAVNGEYAVLIEAKSTLKIEDVNDHLERMEKFKRIFPEYKDRKLVGAVGGIAIEEEADKYAYKKGLFVIVESGENVKLLNDKKFRPAIW